MKKAYILKDKERYIISNDKSGSFRIFLEIDYHQRKASLLTMSCPNWPEHRKDFVFEKSKPKIMQEVGHLISEAGKEAERKLSQDAEYEVIK